MYIVQSELRKTLPCYYLCIHATKTLKQISSSALSSGVEKAFQAHRQASDLVNIVSCLVKPCQGSELEMKM